MGARSSGTNAGWLPTTAREMRGRGWDRPDVVVVSGDAYVDHPSFGTAVVARWLERLGLKVCVLCQPRWDSCEAFREFGEPRLFFAISAGAMDSIVSNLTGNGRLRSEDAFSPGGDPLFPPDAKGGRLRRRPDRATIVYAGRAKEAYPGARVILGGVEASLRRFVHYDYQQQKLRASVLPDSKANLLMFGMGERTYSEIVARLREGRDLSGIDGTVERFSPKEYEARKASGAFPNLAELPSWEAISRDKAEFLRAELAVDRSSRAPGLRETLAQMQQGQWVVQHPASEPLSPEELDEVAELPYMRKPHPSSGDVPAFRMIETSVTAVRGCPGNCAFCAITRHQGPRIVSRTEESILREVERIASAPGFSGTISDVGGPTANLYGADCPRSATCRRHFCLEPDVCPSLDHGGGRRFLRLLERIAANPKVKHLFVSSGLRMELLLRQPELLRKLLLDHTPGRLKIAPEHQDPGILALMRKRSSALLPKFLETARELARRAGRRAEFTPYVISAHPGATIESAERAARAMRDCGLVVEQLQDFTPTPGTLSTAVWYSGLDPETFQPIPVPRGETARRAERETWLRIAGRPSPRGPARGAEPGRPPRNDGRRRR
ncbi:MAG: YgiQ family radical SAM protein [Fibrobacterales bacterium]|nr:YgiQ family radical SAM protein [Fibrobacterales bacterium]